MSVRYSCKSHVQNLYEMAHEKNYDTRSTRKVKIFVKLDFSLKVLNKIRMNRFKNNTID